MAFFQQSPRAVPSAQQQQQPVEEQYQIMNDIASAGFEIMFKFLSLPGAVADCTFGSSKGAVLGVDKAIAKMDISGNTTEKSAAPKMPARAPDTTRSVVLSPDRGFSASPPRGPRTPAATPPSAGGEHASPRMASALSQHSGPAAGCALDAVHLPPLRPAPLIRQEHAHSQAADALAALAAAEAALRREREAREESETTLKRERSQWQANATVHKTAADALQHTLARERVQQKDCAAALTAAEAALRSEQAARRELQAELSRMQKLHQSATLVEKALQGCSAGARAQPLKLLSASGGPHQAPQASPPPAGRGQLLAYSRMKAAYKGVADEPAATPPLSEAGSLSGAAEPGSSAASAPPSPDHLQVRSVLSMARELDAAKGELAEADGLLAARDEAEEELRLELAETTAAMRALEEREAQQGYETEAVLGSGGFGFAELVRRRADGGLFARKTAKSRADWPLHRALAEASILTQLNHPNCLTLLKAELDPAAGELVMLTEFAANGDLRVWWGNGGDERGSMRVFRDICSALGHVHSLYIVHHDVKPPNILVRGDGSGVLADFGLAIATGGTPVTAYAGTAGYIAPEILASQPHTGKADIWSLGCVLHEVYAWNTPWDQQLRQVVLSPGLPVPARDWVRDMLRWSAPDRPSAAELCARYDAAVHGGLL